MNYMIRYLIICVICVLSSCAGLKQNDGGMWRNEDYIKETPESYIQVVSATNRSVSSAKLFAMQAAEFRYMVALCYKKDATFSEGDINLDNTVVKRRILKESVIPSSHGYYTVYLLIQTAKYPDREFEEVNMEDFIKEYLKERNN